MNTKKNFRWDIQGLRAFAVLAVVLFHIAPNRLPGGYLGVDIFFVISGYLIIGFIYRDLLSQQFSLKNFYARRIKRLFPALIATVIATTFGVYIYLTPIETTKYAESVIATLLYISNMFFYTQSGYFAADLKLAPLLHTWSLSVEEQFYIVFPLFITMVLKYKPALFQVSLVIIALASFILSEVLVQIDPSMSFFISPSRFWQFIAGGLLALNIHRIRITPSLSNVIGFTGLGILTVSLLFYTENTIFPGVNAIIPTLSTLGVLLAGSSSSFFTKMMSLPVNQFFGNISYSLYLWHWPVIVFYHLGQNNSLSNMVNNIIVLLISIFLGYISWRFIELRFIGVGTKSGHSKTFIISFGASAFLILLMIYATNGLPHRFNQEQLYYSSFMNYDRTGFRRGTCFIRGSDEDLSFYNKKECINYDKSKYNILLIGDSHAAHWNSAISDLLNPNQTLSQLTSSGCRPALPLVGTKGCIELMTFGLQELIQEFKFDQIIIAGRWEYSEFSKLRNTVNYLSNFAENIVVIGRTLEYKQDLPRLLAITGLVNLKNKTHYDYEFFKNIDDEFKKVTLVNKKISYISIIDLLCSVKSSTNCQAVTNRNVPIAFDYGHFTHEGALEVAEKWFNK